MEAIHGIFAPEEDDTNCWSDAAVKMPLTATDHPRFGDIHTQIKDQVWRLKIILSDVPDKKEHLPFQRSIFFSLGVSRVQVVLWHYL